MRQPKSQTSGLREVAAACLLREHLQVAKKLGQKHAAMLEFLMTEHAAMLALIKPVLSEFERSCLLIVLRGYCEVSVTFLEELPEFVRWCDASSNDLKRKLATRLEQSTLIERLGCVKAVNPRLRFHYEY